MGLWEVLGSIPDMDKKEKENIYLCKKDMKESQNLNCIFIINLKFFLGNFLSCISLIFTLT